MMVMHGHHCTTKLGMMVNRVLIRGVFPQGKYADFAKKDNIMDWTSLLLASLISSRREVPYKYHKPYTVHSYKHHKT